MAPRKRNNPKDSWMPPRVYRGKSAYEWHPQGGGAIRLCDLNAANHEVIQAYEAEQQKLKSRDSLDYVIGLYFNSPQFKKLSANTQRDYRSCSIKVVAVFGKMRPDSIKAVHIRQYMDKRGQQSEPRANKEKAFLSIVLSWAHERGYMIGDNPCHKVRGFSLKPRDRYITDAEYKEVFNRATPNIQAAMEIAYLCAARQRDILDLTVNDIREEGLFIKQGKTGKKQIKAWTPRLRKAVELARSQPSKIKTLILIHTKDGSPYTSSGFRAMWNRIKGEQDFTFHDLKAKGISDFEGDKQKFSGHKSKAIMEDVYNRKPEVVQILDPRDQE